MIGHCAKKGNNWHGMIVKFQFPIEVFLLYAKSRCAKGTLLTRINKRDKSQLYSAVQPLKSNQQNMIQCEILPHCFKHAHIDMNSLLPSLKQESSWQNQELTDKLHSKRALAQQPLFKSTKSHMPHR